MIFYSTLMSGIQVYIPWYEDILTYSLGCAIFAHFQLLTTVRVVCIGFRRVQ